MLGQTLDSIFDAVYFLNLKKNPRMIHVKGHIQVVQAFLLYTCKCFVLRAFDHYIYSAIIKDYIVGRVALNILASYDEQNPNGNVETKAGGKYLIFVVSLFLEDLGQTLCQVCCSLV